MVVCMLSRTAYLSGQGTSDPSLWTACLLLQVGEAGVSGGVKGLQSDIAEPCPGGSARSELARGLLASVQRAVE